MIVVLADDLTGAAEIGGVAWRYGLSAEIQTDFRPSPGAGLIVVDTDTRGCTPQAAAQRVTALVDACRRAGATHFFKKVDSVLRGPVLAEAGALVEALGARRALLAPANPALGRTIRQGQYWVGERRLHETDFANDPAHPARTSDVRALLIERSTPGWDARLPVEVLPAGTPLPAQGIFIGETASSEDVVRWAECIDEGTIPVGAGEFFAAFLAGKGLFPSRTGEPQLPGSDPHMPHADEPNHSGGGQHPSSSDELHLSGAGARLFVCGSTSLSARTFCRRCEERGTPVLRMPVALFDPAHAPGAAIRAWGDAAVRALHSHPQVVVAIDQPVQDLPEHPQMLTDHLGSLVEHILAAYPVKDMFVEGGATAVALVKRLGWGQMRVLQELRPGVVCVQVVGVDAPRVTMKPGSYVWPEGVVRGE